MTGPEAFLHVLHGDGRFNCGQLGDLGKERAWLRMNAEIERHDGNREVLDDVRRGILGRMSSLRAGVRTAIRCKRDGRFDP